MSNVLTVTQVNRFIKSLIDGDGRLRNIYITGEISNFTNHYKSGHLYFSLKDTSGVIKAVMFSDSASRLKFLPKDGMKVVVSGRISLYEATGQYQIYVQSMQPDGLGSLSIAYEQLKERLNNEGLFKKNTPLPLYPTKIGVITSSTGAAFHDIINVLERRWPVCKVVFYPSAVQGDLAETQLTSGIKKLSADSTLDLIIIGRGGGSVEDLWAFNSEELARAIYKSKIPVISAVGHEVDYTICDFVADLRAPTPSAAAELATPDIYEVMDYIESLFERMKNTEENYLQNYRLLLDSYTKSKVLSDPYQIIKIKGKQLDDISFRLTAAQRHILSKEQIILAEICGKIDEMNPIRVLSRGYSYLSDSSGKNVSYVDNINIGDTVSGKICDGKLEMKVLAKEKNNAC